jgi:hypothetical protein
MAREEKPSTPQQMTPSEYLADISPSALSVDLKEFSTIDFKVIVPPSDMFGDYQGALVEAFLKMLNDDELLIMAMIVYSKSFHFLMLVLI